MQLQHYRIAIESVHAQLDPDFATYFPRHLRADLNGSMTIISQSEHRVVSPQIVFKGTYFSRTLIQTRHDDVGAYQIQTFRLDSGSCFVLRPIHGQLESESNEHHFCPASEIGPVFQECLSAYLLTRFGNRPLQRLLPAMEATDLLDEQEEEITRLWREAKKQERRRRKNDADWWKRGEEPPY